VVHPDTVSDCRRISKLDTVSDRMKTDISENMVDRISILQDYLLKEHDIFVKYSWYY